MKLCINEASYSRKKAMDYELIAANDSISGTEGLGELIFEHDAVKDNYLRTMNVLIKRFCPSFHVKGLIAGWEDMK